MQWGLLKMSKMDFLNLKEAEKSTKKVGKVFFCSPFSIHKEATEIWRSVEIFTLSALNAVILCWGLIETFISNKVL